MSAFTFAPQNATRSIQPRIRVANFGDGYEQRIADGINTQKQTWSLSFLGATSTIESIDAYLVGKGGLTSFDWTPPGESSAIRVVCREWSKTEQPGRVSASLTATFEQVFGE